MKGNLSQGLEQSDLAYRRRLVLWESLLAIFEDDCIEKTSESSCTTAMDVKKQEEVITSDGADE